MRFWTAHVRAGGVPVLVREGFSWGALLFGPVWLLAHRAWIAAAVDLALGVLAIALTGGGTAAAIVVALAIGQGLLGNDLVRWSLDLRGYTLAHVIAARDEAGAAGRLLQGRPDLLGAFVRPGELR